MKNKVPEILDMIAKDAERDIKDSEGQAFTGRNVHEMMGKQNAMIQTLALIVKDLVICLIRQESKERTNENRR